MDEASYGVLNAKEMHEKAMSVVKARTWFTHLYDGVGAYQHLGAAGCVWRCRAVCWHVSTLGHCHRGLYFAGLAISGCHRNCLVNLPSPALHLNTGGSGHLAFQKRSTEGQYAVTDASRP